MTQDEKITKVLDRLHKTFGRAVGPRTRRKYMTEHGFQGIDWSFSLSADDIIRQKIPANVAGCTGRAKVFCKYARDANMDCVVLATARVSDLNGSGTTNSHQIIAVRDEKTGQLCAFDPGHRKLEYINAPVELGSVIDFQFDGRPNPHAITAILSPDEYSKVSSYNDIHSLYLHGRLPTKQDKFNSFARGKQKLNFWALLRRRLMREND